MPKWPRQPSPLSLPQRTRHRTVDRQRRPLSRGTVSGVVVSPRSSPTAASPMTTADVTHRAHATIETVFSELIDGPLAHMPPGSFGRTPRGDRTLSVALLRATGIIADSAHAKARGVTLRRKIVNIPARFVRPQRTSTLHLPFRYPWLDAWVQLWRNIIDYSPS